MRQLKSVRHSQRGATLIEYALLSSLLLVIALPVINLTGQTSSESFYIVAEAVGGGTRSTGGPGDSDPLPPDPGNPQYEEAE